MRHSNWTECSVDTPGWRSRLRALPQVFWQSADPVVCCNCSQDVAVDDKQMEAVSSVDDGLER